jgi:hydroxypyruvate reductase
MVSAEAFSTRTLRTLPEGQAVSRILAAALQAVEPGEAVRRHLKREDKRLIVPGTAYDLEAYRGVYLLGIGKASAAMAEAVEEVIGAQVAGGLVITKHLDESNKTKNVKRKEQGRIVFMEGGHLLPDERSLGAGEKVMELVTSLHPDDLLICLISGGGSALMTAPVEGVSLADLQALTSALLVCGARIDEINTLRRHLDRVKGGGLAKLTGGASVVSLILSDVVGNPLEAVASGPTAPDPSSKDEARAVVKRYALQDKIPASLLKALERVPETPKPGEALFSKVRNVIVGSNLLAAQAALRQAQEEGFHPYLLRTDLQGEAREAAFELATFLRQTKQTGQPVPAPACIVAGGETTVTLGPDPGRGGRNTELALAAVTELADFPGVLLATLATDGEDGPTDAAGAVVNGESYRRAIALGQRPAEALRRNDSYSFFAALDDLLKPGPTGTNVNDLTFLFTL